MLDGFNAMRATHQKKLPPEVLERLQAHDKHDPTLEFKTMSFGLPDQPPSSHHHHHHNGSAQKQDSNFGFQTNHHANFTNFTFDGGGGGGGGTLTTSNHNQTSWWIKYALASLAIACVTFLIWKGCLQVGFNGCQDDLTIDDVPDEDLYEAFEPEVAKEEMERRFLRRQRASGALH